MSMAYIAIAVTVIGAGVTYAGQQSAAKAADQNADAQQAAADQAARNEELQTAETVRRERLNTRRRLARLRSQMNAGGVVMSDSSMDVFAETAGTEELAIQDLSRAGNLQSQNQRAAGAMGAWEARALARSTRVQSYGTLLSSTSSAVSTYRTS